MLYEYEINDNLSTEEIENMLIESRILKRNYINLFILLFTIFMGILLLIGYMIDNRIFIIGTKFFIGTYLLCIFILFLFRESSIKSIAKNFAAKNINKIRNKKQTIEIQSDICTYGKDKFKAVLTKNIVIEILSFKEYTVLIISPKLFKYILFMNPIIIPNDLFGSDDKYNEFIKKIS